MKYFIIVFLFLLTSCKKDSEKNGRIEIIPTYCKYDNDKLHSTDKPKLFKKGENDTEIKLTEKNSIPGTENFKVSNLEYGNYYIEYTTIYNQKNIVQFNVDKSDLKKVEFCVDFLDYKSNKNILLIDELKNGEDLVLEFFHQGCFSTYEKPVIFTLTKTSNKIVAEYNGKKYPLSETKVGLFREFEIELKSNHCGGCTSEDTYVLFNRKSYGIYEVKDSSCQWRGFDNLIKAITGKK